MGTKRLQLIVPMSGLGKRFLKAGYKIPKPLIEVDGKAMVEHVVELFPDVHEILFICNQEHLDDPMWNMRQRLMDIAPKAKIVSIPIARGPVEAILKAKEYVLPDHEIIVSYCDYGTAWDFNQFLKDIEHGNFDGMIPCYIGFHPHLLGSDNYAFCKHTNRILEQIKEKETFTGKKMEEYASNGSYYFKSSSLMLQYFQELVDTNVHLNGEFYVSLVYNLLVRDGLKVGIFEIQKMLQWGTPKDMEEYNNWSKYFRQRKSQKIINHPVPTTLILPAAGYGKRFSDAGYTSPKPLLDVDGQPMILAATTILPQMEDQVFILLKDHDKHFDLPKVIETQFPKARCLTIDAVTDGQARTCYLGIEHFQVSPYSSILISACDNAAVYDAEKYDELVRDTTNDVIVWSFRHHPSSRNNPNMYSWLNVDDNGYLISEHSKHCIFSDPFNHHAIIGTMFFRRAFDFIKTFLANVDENLRTNGELYVDDVLNRCVSLGLKVKVFEVENYICWGTPNDYKTYQYWLEYFESKGV